MKVGSIIEMNNINKYEETNIKVYQKLIVKLMYLFCGIKIVILFVIEQLSRQNADPKIGSLKVVRQIVQYAKGIIYLNIIYKTNNSPSQEASN